MRFAVYLIFLCCSLVWAESRPDLGLPPLEIPLLNPQTEEKVALGKRLFHDKRFSANAQVSCATCHDSGKAFTDHEPVSKGIDQLKGARNAPSVINAAFSKTQFWDGRAPDLETQSIQPMLNPIEMGMHDKQAVLAVIKDDPSYPDQFARVFAIDSSAIDIGHVAKALASYERTLISGNAPFDRYYFENDQAAISQAAKRGLSVFFNQAACASCHLLDRGFALFTDHQFHNIGVGYDKIAVVLEKLAYQDETDLSVANVQALSGSHASELGRFLVSQRLLDLGAFKTPTLRNIEKTPPYMHDGSLATLEAVVDYYNTGGAVSGARPESRFIDPRIRPLHLTDQQKSDLVTFMRSLTSPEYQEIPVAKTDKERAELN